MPLAVGVLGPKVSTDLERRPGRARRLLQGWNYQNRRILVQEKEEVR